jgi:4-diphosphocytidyl-2C-methyl-D-erythritol kinase
MLDWDTALLSQNNFEIMKERLKLGPALTMLQDLASDVALDIPEFIQEMREQAQKYGEDLARYEPQYEPSIQNGISKHTATVMMDELSEKSQLATIEIGKLSNERAQAGIAMLNVKRLASLRVFFDEEALQFD